ncbi:MAG: preprotein translocase subunit YajC [Sedimentisphaerales bacterium]|nr:preprotein translocase subunit YajC [Sedimentisphaerales bacterium]
MLDMFFLAQAEVNPQQLQGVEGESQTQVSVVAEGQEGGEVPVKGPESPWMSLAPIVLMVVIVYFFMLRGPQKKEKERKRMLGELKKNDKVRTIGGIIATVVEVRDKEVVLKIDESNNTRIKVVREAIGEVFAE